MDFRQTYSQPRSTLLELKKSTHTLFYHHPLTWAALAWAFIALGIFYRVFHYLDNRSFWIDEIYLSSSLIKMGFLQLTSPVLEYEQKAPIGYLWMARLAVMVFGKGEMALRLFPLTCGVASLFVFRSVARAYLKPMGVAVALGILALAPPMVYHAVEAKQYSTAALTTVLALYMYTRYHDRLAFPQLFCWGLWGAILIWFSFAVIFVLAGMAFAVCLSYIMKKDWRSLLLSMIPFSLWLFSFVVNYYLFTYRHANSDWLVEWFRIRESFMPLPPTSLMDFKWFLSQGYLLLEYPLGLLWQFINVKTQSKLLEAALNMHFIPVPFLAAGVIYLYRSNKTLLMVLFFPLLLALLASGFERYPFYERLLVFLAPALILIVAFGTQTLAGYFPLHSAWRYAMPILILAGPMHASAQQAYNTELFGGRKHWHLRDALLYINSRIKKGDIAYISWNAIPEYRFYKEVYNFKFDVMEGQDVRKKSKNTADYFRNLKPDIKAMARYDRAWVLINKEMGANIGEVETAKDMFGTKLKDGKRFVKLLSAIARQKDAYRSKDTDVYLFEFTNN